MNKAIYTKLAKQNLIKNKALYGPFMLASVATIAMYYMMESIRINAGLDAMAKTAQLKDILGLGTIVIGIFSLIFLFYTNGFLIKRRTKEIALYNILGMEKKHIGKMMFIEVVIVGLLSMTGGIVIGMVFSKLMYLVLLKLLSFDTGFKYVITSGPIINTIKLFIIIDILTLISNLIKIKVAKPIELLKGGQVGEKEPKSKKLLALSGVISLALAYTIAIVIKSPLMAISFFFIAVVLVMYGTYALFTAGSIVVLKQLKKKKKFYYKAKYFTSVSSLIYRMKQNAVGLSNICILSTAVLIMLSSTLSLYVGMEDVLNTRFQYDVSVSGFEVSDDNVEYINEIIYNASVNNGVELEDYYSLRFSGFPMLNGKDGLKMLKGMGFSANQMSMVSIVTLEEFNKVENQSYSLEEGEAFIYSSNEDDISEIMFEGVPIKASSEKPEFTLLGDQPQVLTENYFFVVKDIDTLIGLYNIGCESSYSHLDLDLGFNVIGDLESELAFIKEVRNKVNRIEAKVLGVNARETEKEGILAIAGGLFFLGIFLGVLFLIATSLIIYYKQVSEGYDDRERFVIMQKVGMSHSEVKKSIKSQIRLVFFLPLVTAFIHVLAAFKMISRLLIVLNFNNEILYFICTLGSFLIFGLIYIGVYSYTAKIYYRIVTS